MKIKIKLHSNGIYFPTLFLDTYRDDGLEIYSNNYEIELVWGNRNIRRGINLVLKMIKMIEDAKNEN
jgi:hypothetical protein